MAGIKEIRTKISSIKSTQKITSAMEMVAASKMRKAQQNRDRSRPYAEAMYNVIGHLANADPDYDHPFMAERDVKRVGYIIISSDRGLCGGLNTNLFKKAISGMKAWHDQHVEIDLCLIGSKAEAFFHRFGGNVIASTRQLGDDIDLTDLIGNVKVMLDSFEQGRIDQLQLVFNNFVNTMTQEPWDVQLLPLKPGDDLKNKHHWDYIYEPDVKELLNGLMIRYIETLTYQAVVENNACEQAARMVAMKSATDNAGDIIDELQLVYNKARQASITQEISEIVSGAAAV